MKTDIFILALISISLTYLFLSLKFQTRIVIKLSKSVKNIFAFLHLFLVSLSVLLFLVLCYFDFHSLNIPIIIRFSAFLLIACGLYLFVASVFKLTPQAILFPSDSDKLEVKGLYQRVRNPLYLGVILMALGTAIFVSSVLVLIWTIFLFAWIYLITLLEEFDLEKRYKETYKNYKKQVGRFIPKIK